MAEYIEREAVLDYIDKRIPKLIASADGKHIVYVEAIRDVIVKFPAADVAPVRHGHWVKEKKDALIHWHCSACKECYFLEEPNAKYCPNCGAKMDGDPYE